MVYPPNFEQKIGFDRLRQQIASLCTMRLARERLASELFSKARSEVDKRLSLSDEMRHLLQFQQGFVSGDYPDIDHVVDKLKVQGSFLTQEEVVLLSQALKTVDRVVAFILPRKAEYPTLYSITEGVAIFPTIIARIDSIVDRFGDVRDSASPELAQIRRTIRDLEGKAAKRMQQLLQSAKGAGVVDADAQISIRDGRAVIPVAAANKRKLNGLIQDESATGKTFYIEPFEVVEINNELREAEYAQKREIVRILTELTEEVRPSQQEISRSAEYLAHIDMLRAKARWAAENRCVRPIVSVDDKLFLKDARHPILQQSLKAQSRAVVPLNLQVDNKKRILVISGPNAGGKSVCLKTVGIIQYMFQCGFLVPVSEISELPIFDSLFIDIGDEQSIDNDLSTYSSHLLNMKSLLANVNERSLVLLDEFGSGTEPIIGGAIAEAILERLLCRGCYGVITTHYANIKYFASNNEGVANGAMMFDVQNIRPLFALEIGKPGSSFAVEIARKIGLPEDIIQSASEKAGHDHINIEKQLREIARDRRYWEQKRDRIRRTDRKVEELEQSYSDKLTKIKEQRDSILHSAKVQAKELLADANRQIESTIKAIRESQAEKEFTRFARQELNDFHSSISDDAPTKGGTKGSNIDVAREIERIERRAERRAERRSERDAQEKSTESAPTPKVVEVGSKVRIEGQDIVGEVKEIKGTKARVAFGQILTQVAVKKLTVVSSAEWREATRPTSARTIISTNISQRKLNFKDNIDIRGMRALEALEAIQEFIDDALMVGVDRVTILHGKGTGALKEQIRQYLRSVPQVASARDEHADRGGAGITVVEFD